MQRRTCCRAGEHRGGARKVTGRQQPREDGGERPRLLHSLRCLLHAAMHASSRQPGSVAASEPCGFLLGY